MPDLKTAMRAAEKSEDIQALFLNTARRDRILVHILLLNGTRLIGKIRSFDKWSLILDLNNQDQLIYKHAIATISLTSSTRGGSNPNGGVQTSGAAAPNTHSEG